LRIPANSVALLADKGSRARGEQQAITSRAAP
jgi:hypothetical protein